MTYYLAKVEFGEDGTLTVTYRVPNSTPALGPPPLDIRNETILEIPTTLEPTLPGGATRLSTPEAPEGGAASTVRAAGGEATSRERPRRPGRLGAGLRGRKGEVMSIGQDEDAKAFGDWLESLSQGDIKAGVTTFFSEAEVRFDLGAILRQAFDAGMKRDEEKRGCCEKPDAS